MTSDVTARYLARIGATAGEPTHDTLAHVLDRHTAAIPFENLDVLLGTIPSLELEGLVAKLVTSRRGGYCYEHATLMGHILDDLGFTVHRHSARVLLARPKHEAPRSHMYLTVELPGGPVVVDPGFGAAAARVPVPLDGTRAGNHWLVRDGDDLMLMLETPSRSMPLWVSSLEREYPIDAFVANHFTATSPLSHFTYSLTMRAFIEDGKVTVRNRLVTFATDEGERTCELANGHELRALCREYFGFDLPALDELMLPT